MRFRHAGYGERHGQANQVKPENPTKNGESPMIRRAQKATSWIYEEAAGGEEGCKDEG
jgi:hypothetical protein